MILTTLPTVPGYEITTLKGLVFAAGNAAFTLEGTANKASTAMDKAGAYGIQDFIGMVGIEKLEGSFYTVMGLPIFKVYQALKPFVLEGRELIMNYEL